MLLFRLRHLFNLGFCKALIITFAKKIVNKFTSTRTREENEQEISPLPTDVASEIITRVPLQSLYSCRSVCKHWRQLTIDPHFIHQHCLRTQSISGFFIQSIDIIKFKASFVPIDQPPPNLHLSLDFLPESVRIEASSFHGLLCCIGQHARNNQYYICKPTTKQYIKLPKPAKPRTRFFTAKIGLIVQPHEPFHFKILRLSQRSRMSCENFHCEIFDSQRWTWKRLRDIWLPSRFYLELGSAVSVNGSCHWLIKHHRTGEVRVLAFDVERESWRTIQMPQEHDLEEEDDGFYNEEVLVDCRGQLSFIQVTNDWMRIWILSDYRGEIWRKKDKISLEMFNRETPFFSVKSLYTEEVVFMANLYKVIWYNYESSMLTEVKMKPQLPRNCYVFQSDLLPCKMFWR